MPKTYTEQELHNLAARLRSTHCEPGTDPDAFEASDAIHFLLADRERIAVAIEEISVTMAASWCPDPHDAAVHMQRMAAEAARSGGASL